MERRTGFLERTMRLRWVFRIVIGLIIIALIIFAYMFWRQIELRRDARESVREQIRAKGVAIAQTIAVTSREDIMESRYDDLQDYFEDLVGQPDVRYIAVMTPEGRAVVHTNARFRGRVLDDAVSRKAAAADDVFVQDIAREDIYDIAVPVMAFTRKAAVVRVGVSYAQVQRMFR
ncbi:MAG: hypothetical protein HYX78_09790 [Armatimonadetes bacterium]|nr:hypothetical protein [Armatimonadota bacterium]